MGRNNKRRRGGGRGDGGRGDGDRKLSKSSYRGGQECGTGPAPSRSFWAFECAGALLTCEPGREIRCFRDAVQILSYYSGIGPSAVDTDVGVEKGAKADVATAAPLSLEEELAVLRGGGESEGDAPKKGKKRGGKRKWNARFGDGPFRMVELGVRGCVFLCFGNSDLTAPADTPIQDNTSLEKDESAEKNDPIEKDPPVAKDIPANTAPAASLFDSVRLIHAALSDAAVIASSASSASVSALERARRAPSSRFITRMVPVQMTCFADMGEIERCAEALVKEHMSGALLENVDDGADTEKETFRIDFRRRNCSHLKRDAVIDIVAGKVDMEKFAVKLGKSGEVGMQGADFVIMVDVCRTFVMMGIVRREDRMVEVTVPEELCEENDSIRPAGATKKIYMDNFNLSELVQLASSKDIP